MNIPKREDLISKNHLGVLYIKKRYPEFYQYLIDRYDGCVSSDKMSEKLYLYYNNMDYCPVCPICGKRVPFLGFFDKGYQTYCSLKCSNKSPEVIKRKEDVCLKKYGVKHACQNNDIKRKLIQTSIKNNGGMGNASDSVKEKHYNTMISKYGVKHALNYDEFKRKTISTRVKNSGSIENSYKLSHEKQRCTNKDKYGVYELFNSNIVRDKINHTNFIKYGGHPMYSQDVKSKVISTKHNNRIKQRDDLLYIKEDGTWVVKCPHNDCSKCNERYFDIDYSMLWDRMKDGTEICTKLLPPQHSYNKGTTIELIIRNILDKYNIEYICNDKNILHGKELDIYIPSKKLAIECNGCYWHASNVPNNYTPINKHYDKFKSCKDEGIQLLTLWQDWIFYKINIIESIILNKLGLINPKIYARKCNVKNITVNECNTFLDSNHIQGASKANIHYGLYYNNELVSVMTFIKRRNNVWELNRFCSKLNTRVVGGASKLLNHFIKENDPEIIRSFSLNDISNGNLYKQLGFAEYSYNIPYWYISKDCKKRYHREYGRKDAIIKRGDAPTLNKSEWKESEVMYQSGYLQIYSSGMIGWELKKD